MNFHGVVMNVRDLKRSIGFYREALGFTLLSEEEQLAAVRAPGNDQPQVIVLRALGSAPIGGARHVGLRAFMLEAESADQLEQVASALQSRNLLTDRRDHRAWSAVIGHDPDGVAVVVAWHPDGGQASEESWRTLDDVLYGIGE